MKIGVISDTHLAGEGTGLPCQVFDVFNNVDLILHCGDLECIGVLDELEKLAPVQGVRGYEDPMEPGDRLSDRTRVIHLHNTENISIGMVLDIQWPYPPIYTSPDGRSIILPEEREETKTILKKKFGYAVDVVLFGDTHEELIIWEHGILWMNPGSPTYPGKNHDSVGLGTVGIINVDGPTIEACIIDLKTHTGLDRG